MMAPLLLAGAAVVAWLAWRSPSDAPPAHLPGPAMSTQTQRRDFVRLWYDTIRRQLPSLSVPAQRLALAHAAYESGFGSGFAARQANNPWNITAGSWWLARQRDVLRQENADDDYRPDGSVVRIAQTWRRYDNRDEAVRDYRDFLTTQNGGRYLPAWRALEAGDVTRFATELRAAGYFTFPLDAYRKNLQAVLGAVVKELT